MCLRDMQHFSVLGRVLHQCHLLRSDMINFVLALSNYVMFEVLETSWQWLVNKVKGDDEAATAVALGRADMPNAAESGVEITDITRNSQADRATTAHPRPQETSTVNEEGGGSKWWDNSLDLSGLIRAHEQYLATIMEKALLTGKFVPLDRYSLHASFSNGAFLAIPRPILAHWPAYPGSAR